MMISLLNAGRASTKLDRDVRSKARIGDGISGFQVFCSLQDDVKKLLNVFLFNAGKGHTEICLA